LFLVLFGLKTQHQIMMSDCILIKICHRFRVFLCSCLWYILFGFWPW